MKKFLLSAGALLLVVGLGLSWMGVRMGGETQATVRLFGRSWEVFAPSAGWGVVTVQANHERTASATSIPVDEAAEDVVPTSHDVTPFTSIDLDVDLGNVTIAAGDGYGVDIRSWGAGYQIDHWYSGGTLTIESTDSGSVLPANCGSEITVYVPSDVWLESLRVDLDLGSLTLAGLQLEYAEIALDLGDLTGEALTVATSMQVEASLGAVNLFGDLGEYVAISADLGSVQLGLTRPASEYCCELEADMGSVTVDGRKQRLGDDSEIICGYGDRVIEVDASLGSITVDFDQDFAGEARRTASSSEAPVTFIPEEVQEGAATVTEDRGTLSALEGDWAETAE